MVPKGEWKSPERVPRRSSHFPKKKRFKLKVVDFGILSHPVEVASDGLVRSGSHNYYEFHVILVVTVARMGEHSKVDSCLHKLIFVPKMIRIAWGWSSSQTTHSVAQLPIEDNPENGTSVGSQDARSFHVPRNALHVPQFRPQKRYPSLPKLSATLHGWPNAAAPAVQLGYGHSVANNERNQSLLNSIVVVRCMHDVCLANDFKNCSPSFCEHV